jgi:transposase InsO family protein
MTNREMVMADLNLSDINLSSLAAINARQRARLNSADYLLTNTNNDDISDDGEAFNDDADLNPLNPNLLQSNPHDQPLHPDEDALRGKLAVDVPAFSANDLYAIRICSKVRQYLTDGTIAEENVNQKFRKAVIKMAKSCFLHEGKLYRKRRGIIREVCDSYNLRRDALKASHDGTTHRGVENTLNYLGSRFWFPQMEKFVCRYIAQCGRCQRFARSGPVEPFPNYAFEISDILAHWNIDFAGPFPEDMFGFKYVCIGVERISRWAEIRCSTTNTAADAANFLYHDIICRFGLPKSIQSDNGPHFANEVIERLTQILEIRHKFSTPYYPQSNGRAERLIGTLKSMMVKAVEDTDRDEANGTVNWQPAIYTALYVYRASPHHATGVSPAYLLYGENISLPFLHAHQPPNNPRDQVTHKQQMLDRLAYIREAIPGLRGAHHQFARSKEGRKVLVRPTKYSVGDEVLMQNPNSSYVGYGSAFGSPYIGPYQVRSIGDKGTYRLATIPKEDGKRSRLLKYPINWSRLRRFVPEGDDKFFVKENANEEILEI